MGITEWALGLSGACLLAIGGYRVLRARRSRRVWHRDVVAVGALALGVLMLGTGLVVGLAPAPEEGRSALVEPSGGGETAKGDADVSPAVDGSPGPEAGSPPVGDGSAPGQAADPGSAPPSGPSGSTIDEDNAYRRALIGVNNEIAEHLDQLTRHLLTADYDDEAWLAATRVTLSGMGSAATKARAVRPPARFAAAHESWMEGIDSYEWVATNMAVAIEGPDQALMSRCTTRLEEASLSFQRATMLMEQAGP